MTKAREIAIVVLLGTATFVLAALGYYGCFALQEFAAAGTEAAKTFETINRPCGVQGKPCGTLADLNETLGTIRHTVGLAEAAAKHEDAQLTTLDAQEKTIFEKVVSVLTDARSTLQGLTGLTQVASGTLQTTQETIKTVPPAVASLGKSSDALTALLVALKSRSDDQRIDVLLTHLDGMAQHGDATTQHIDAATGDIAGAVHKVTNPPPCTGRWCWFTRPVKTIWELRELPEPIYYLQQLFHP
ncbi:hypothetical protein DYQ86_16075 [Acidobacteria bacterium AB60]|nr:hypothetical protein DYQ86_16075 [Acidobacteria bacterium AB60]